MGRTKKAGHKDPLYCEGDSRTPERYPGWAQANPLFAPSRPFPKSSPLTSSPMNGRLKGLNRECNFSLPSSRISYAIECQNGGTAYFWYFRNLWRRNRYHKPQVHDSCWSETIVRRRRWIEP